MMVTKKVGGGGGKNVSGTQEPLARLYEKKKKKKHPKYSYLLQT